MRARPGMMTRSAASGGLSLLLHDGFRHQRRDLDADVGDPPRAVREARAPRSSPRAASRPDDPSEIGAFQPWGGASTPECFRKTLGKAGAVSDKKHDKTKS